MRKIFCAILVCFVAHLPAVAQLTDSINRHVIVAFDSYPDAARFRPQLLHDAKTVTDHIEDVLRSLRLTSEDYVSVVGYGIGTQDIALRYYAAPVWLNGKEYAWLPFSSFTDLWGPSYTNYYKFVSYHQNEGVAFSMLTGAKFYSLQSLFGKNGDKFANKTYMVMVTDNQYNGQGDMDAEFVHFMHSDAQFNKAMTREEFRNTCIEVSNNYNYVYQGESVINYLHSAKIYTAMLFEVRPSSSFSLNSAVTYPANLGLERVRGGYRLKFDYSLIDPNYTVKKLQVITEKKDGGLLKTDYVGDNGHIEIFLNSDNLRSDSVTITLKGWLRKLDKVYGSAILNPNDETFKHLAVTETLSLDEGEKVFGVLSLGDTFWWWYPDSLHKAVRTWNFILLVIAVIVMIFLFYKLYRYLTRYTPKNSDITVECRK